MDVNSYCHGYGYHFHVAVNHRAVPVNWDWSLQERSLSWPGSLRRIRRLKLIVKIEPRRDRFLDEYHGCLVQVNKALYDLNSFLGGHDHFKHLDVEIQGHSRSTDKNWVDLFAPLGLFAGTKHFKFGNISVEASTSIEQSAARTHPQTTVINVMKIYRPLLDTANQFLNKQSDAESDQDAQMRRVSTCMDRTVIALGFDDYMTIPRDKQLRKALGDLERSLPEVRKEVLDGCAVFGKFFDKVKQIRK